MADEAKARMSEAKFTPGPWRWGGYRRSFMYLMSSAAPGGQTVMDFTRQGMQGAQPRFQVDRLMEPAADLAVQEVPYRDDIVDIDHPDAHLIRAAPRLYAALENILNCPQCRPKPIAENGHLDEALAALREARGES